MKPNYLLIAYNCKTSIKRENGDFKPRNYGAYIVKWYRKHPNLDYTINHMYVIKKDGNGYKRGQKVFKKPDVPYRDIYFYPEETRKALRELLICFDIPAKNQIGFTRNRGIQNLMQTEPHRTDLTRVKLDLKDAFNSIKQEQIFWLLRVVFDVNIKLANELSLNWTHNGHMLQGHPLAPAIFNLVTRDLNNWLSTKTGLIQYADDILIYEESDYISWKWLRIIFRKFKDLGFEMNVEKEGFYHKRKDLTFLGLHFTYDENKPLVSAKRKARRKYIRQLKRTMRPDNPIRIGNENWYWYNPKKIVLNKIQSQISMDFIPQSGDSTTNINQNKHQSGGKDKNLWKLWSNPASFSFNYD